MTIFQFIDTMIVRLNEMEVKGAGNMAIVVQTINDLNQLKSVIHVEDEKEEQQDGTDDHDT